MLSSLGCFAILMLLDDPQGPPPATPGPVNCVFTSSEQNRFPVVAETGPDSKSAAPKHTLQASVYVELKTLASKRCRVCRTDCGAFG